MDRKEIAALVRMMRKEGASEFTWEEGGNKLQVRFGGFEGAPVAVPVAAAAPVAAAPPAASPRPAAAAEGKVIKAPIVGTFYRAPSPEAAPYVNIGDTVRKGQVVCIVEAMKLLNQIESDIDGIVTEIFVENGRPVQFGQELFRLAAR